MSLCSSRVRVTLVQRSGYLRLYYWYWIPVIDFASRCDILGRKVTSYFILFHFIPFFSTKVTGCRQKLNIKRLEENKDQRFFQRKLLKFEFTIRFKHRGKCVFSCILGNYCGIRYFVESSWGRTVESNNLSFISSELTFDTTGKARTPSTWRLLF